MSGDPCICGDTKTWHQECYRRALAAQAPQAAEPVAWIKQGTIDGLRETGFLYSVELWREPRSDLVPLYLAPQAPAAQPLTLELIQANGEFCVSLNDYRIAGPKPWAGGAVIKRWSVSMADINSALGIAPSAQGEKP